MADDIYVEVLTSPAASIDFDDSHTLGSRSPGGMSYITILPTDTPSTVIERMLRYCEYGKHYANERDLPMYDVTTNVVHRSRMTRVCHSCYSQHGKG